MIVFIVYFAVESREKFREQTKRRVARSNVERKRTAP